LQYWYVIITNINYEIYDNLIYLKQLIYILGAGVNLSNNKPTTCINDAILQYNQKYGTKLEMLSHEKYLALIFNEMETLLDILQNGNTEHFYQLYYKYWLHT